MLFKRFWARRQEADAEPRTETPMQEITAEFSAEELGSALPEEPLRVVPRVKFVARSEIGHARENNEDKFDFYEPDETSLLAARGCVYLVCDGMGGHNAGQIASELAAKQFLHAYYHLGGVAQEAARHAVQLAHQYIAEMASKIPSRYGMGTTLTALILKQDEGILVQVGDSRCYRLREGRFEQLSRDQTLVAHLVEQGILTPEQAKYHPQRNVIRQAVGVHDPSEPFEPDIETFPLQAGDVYLLCSDGLTDMVDDAEIEAILRSEPLTRAAWKLVDRALANGGRDNVTVMLLQIQGLQPVEQV
ncbi:MAG: protein phosphatase 2C domain-containing protein [Fimbriimonadales bacterium]|nr:protein phosphatase 2C domain-containing protein [Fimbriimonadales bacterium]